MTITVEKKAEPATPLSGYLTEWYDSTDLIMRAKDDAGRIYSMIDSGWRAKNYLLNGGFDFAQRQTPSTLTTYSSTTARVLTADRWGITNGAASTQYARVDDSAAPLTNASARYHGRFLKITGSGKVCISQVLETVEAMSLRGKTIRLTAKIAHITGAHSWHLALIQLTSAGTADALPATFISAFNGTGVEPTWGTNLASIAPASAGVGGTLTGISVKQLTTTTFAQLSGTFLVPTNCKNLVFVLYSDDSLAVNDDFLLTEGAIYDTRDDVAAWTPRPYSQELALCQRYYAKTFLVDTGPVQNPGVNTGEVKYIAGIAGSGTAGGERGGSWRFPAAMRATPTITTFNPAAANAQVRDETAAADCSATTVVGTTADQTAWTATGNAATVVGGLLGLHVTADAEL